MVFFLKQINAKFKKLGLILFFYLLFKKILKTFIIVVTCVIILPLSVIIFLISPIIKLRFGQIQNSVFGHYLFDTEYYLRKKSINNLCFDFFYFHSKIKINSFLDKLVKRNFNINFIFYFFHLNSKIFFKNTNSVILNPSTARDSEGIFYKTRSQLILRKNELKEGNKFLKKIGLKKNQKYVCLINRDESYKKKYISELVAKKNWKYHDYRNSDINDYKRAINYLLKKNYFVIRMGKGVKDKLNLKHKNFLDYAKSKYRSDFLDIFLMSNSFFNIVSESGLLLTSHIYNVPNCFVNLAVIKGCQTWYNKNLAIFKKIWSIKDKKFLSLKEINLLSDPKNYSSPYIRNYNTVYFFEDKQKYKIINNTSKEILDAVIETEKKTIQNNWSKRSISYMERLFWNNFPFEKFYHGPKIRSHIGLQFIKDNRYLIK